MMLTRYESKSSRVKGLAFHPKQPWILCSLHSGTIQLLDYRMETLIDKFEEHDGPVRGVDFHSNQPLFVSGGDDYKIKVWNYQTRKCLFNLLGHLDYIRTVKFHREYPWILSASDDQTIRIWNWQSRSCVSVLTGHNHYVMCATFHPTLDLILSASLDQTVRVWDFSGLRKKTVFSASGNPSVKEFQDRRQPAAATSNPDLFGAVDVVVKFVLEGHQRGVNWAAFHPSQPLIVSGADDREVKLWRMNESKAWEVDTMRGHVSNVSCAVFHPREDIIISNSEDKTIRIWDMSRKTSPVSFRREHDRYWILAVHPTLSILAAGHDSGMFVFKLGRERPPYDVYKQQLYYCKNKMIRSYELGKGTDTALISIRPASQVKSTPRHLVYNSFNTSEHDFLLLSDYEGGSYELYSCSQASSNGQPRSGTNCHRGMGKFVAFVARNRFAVLDQGTRLSLKDLQNDVKKIIDLPYTNVTSLFPAGLGRVILGTSDRLILFDIQSKKSLGELSIKTRYQFKMCLWSRDKQYVAFLSKYLIYICDANLVELCCIKETTRMKVGVWDDDGIFIYTCINHMKYCLVNGDSGIICSLSVPIYMTAIKDNIVYFLDRDHTASQMTIDKTEALFKRALIARRYGEVLKIIQSNKLVGQSIIGYLQKKGFPEVALHFVEDERTKFSLAIQSGQIDVAFKSAKAVNLPESWRSLAREALRQGNREMVELAYQQTKEFERLSFLYLISGDREKLAKMLHISKLREDNQSRFYNSLLLGDVRERVTLLIETGQPALAYILAKSHGLEVPESLSSVGNDIADIDNIINNAMLCLPPQPVSMSGNWPRLEIARGYFDGATNELVVREEPIVPVVEQEELDLNEWGVDAGGIPPAAPSITPKAIESTGWDVDLLDDIPGLDVTVNPAIDFQDNGASDDYFIMPSPGESPMDAWSKSSWAGEIIAAGEFELAMQSLRRKIGQVNFGPMRDLFLAIRASSHVRLPGVPGTSSVSSPSLRGVEQSGPWVTANMAACQTIIDEGIVMFVDVSLLPQAETQIREALIRLALIVESGPAVQERVDQCREYITASRLAIAKQGYPDDIERQCELATLITMCKLQIPHVFLSLYSAIGLAMKAKNHTLAGWLSRRFLELSLTRQLPANLGPAKDKIKQVARHCDANNSNLSSMTFEFWSPFQIDSMQLKPIPSTQSIVKCPFCESTYDPSSRHEICVTCSISKIGIDVDGV